MGTIIAMFIGLVALTFLPTLAIGWLLKGWRPYLASCLIFVGFLVFHPNVNFHPIASFLHYFVIVALYALGGKVRTGKSTDQILSGKTQGEM